MKIKTFALCAIAAALAGCNNSSDNNSNTLGTISLSGTPLSGETLTVAVSDENGITNDITYIWYADGTTIADATSPSFTLTDDQIGTAITAQALYTDDAGFNESHITDATSDVSAIAFESSVSITGDALIGATLTAAVSDENGIENASITYTWFADDVAIADEVTSTLTLTEAQFGAVITVGVAFTDDRGFAESATSLGTDPVQRTNSQGSVAITGTPTVGNTLTAEIADEDGATGDISYQWLADDVAISGATNNTYLVEAALIGMAISVQVTYTDDNGFAESNTSEATAPVTAELVPAQGSIEITGSFPYLTSGELTADISDNNGFSQENVTFTWYADDVAIADTNNATFTPADYAGAIISVSATYTDNDGFDESLSTALESVIYTEVVNSSATLADAIAAAASGDVIGLNTATYADVSEISLAAAVTLRAVEGETPELTGELCLHVADGVDGATISGLTLKSINTLPDSTCDGEDSVIYSEGDNFTFSNNTIDGEAETLNNTEYQWVMLKGQGALIERNTFTGRTQAEEGSFIKMSSSSSDHVIQYNLFSDSANANYNNSSLYLMQVGSTTGVDAATSSNITIQYNRVENVVTGRRLMRVQTSGATIKGNTIFNPNGGISLEDGGYNTVSDNVIIRTTDLTDGDSDDRPSGVLITPLGHTISNNYIAGIRSGNKEAGGIVFTPNPFSQGSGDDNYGLPNAGNQAILDNGTASFKLNVTNNTVLNSLQPIVFSTEIGSRAEGGVGDCDELATTSTLYSLVVNNFNINFDGNLMANGLGADDTAAATTVGLYFDSEAISSDHSFEYDCDLIDQTNSSLTNNFGFMDSRVSGDSDENWVEIRKLNGNGNFDTDGAIDQNPADNGKEAPDFVTAESTLIETNPDGAQSLAGARDLHYIQTAEVGAGSTWTMTNED
ncbi:poly(beta-D-mannuronate) lyase [Pseudoalteromonas sp. MMG010]|uniref:chondroitinase-B domain-containing protein n=1 Tax=Pseudoalteromonas sp. MMG010 TaxID=2822685 RepID=UPI001B3A006A|nr:chondroitinase-B domain-containing protein [Pseudoalteromonas sp. MMG010]MBQ4833724.1 poly(beta-D-mannuronate) lyase [Pseudoalteromonas sp. MMG010]